MAELAVVFGIRAEPDEPCQNIAADSSTHAQSLRSGAAPRLATEGSQAQD